MTSVGRSAIVPPASILVLLVLFGCGAGEDETNGENWTVQKNAVHLEQDLLVSDNADFYFGRIHDVAVDVNGRMYVADGEAHHVKILSRSGTLLDSLGTHGEGPGEFERPSQVFFAPGDSLDVLDGYYGRLSAFGPPLCLSRVGESGARKSSTYHAPARTPRLSRPLFLPLSPE